MISGKSLPLEVLASKPLIYVFSTINFLIH